MASTSYAPPNPRERFSSEEVVATYKSLANVERDFRSLKSVDVHTRPIRHRLADRVQAHAFICLLAAHVVWHPRRAWAPLTFTDEAPPHTPIPSHPSGARLAQQRRLTARKSCDGEHLRPFEGLLDHLATLTRNTCTLPLALT